MKLGSALLILSLTGCEIGESTQPPRVIRTPLEQQAKNKTAWANAGLRRDFKAPC